MKPIKVLHLTLSFAPGGRREAIANLCGGLAALGVDNHLCCLDDFGCKPTEMDCFAGALELHRRRLFDWQALRKLRQYCDSRHIDIVHTHDAASEAAGLLSLRLRHPPLLMTFHRTRNFESATPRARLRNALAGLRVSAVITASEERRQRYLSDNHIRKSKVLCIPLGVNLDRFKPAADLRRDRRAQLGIADDTVLVGSVGHFGAEKGIDLAIDAFQEFCRRNPHLPCKLVILGTGSQDREDAVRSHVSAEFAERIHFAGFQHSLERWFPAFDALLHGARSEAFGLVIAEAMACGVPVVATKVGGIPELIEDGRTGMLAEPEPAALADALQSALTTPGWLANASVAAADHARERFDAGLYAHRYFELYQRLLAG